MSYFCAELSSQANEDPIGTASTHRSYVLVESPPPWAARATDSNFVPDNLKTLIQATTGSVQFLFFAGDRSQPRQPIRILLFNQADGLTNGYVSHRLQVQTMTDVAPVVRDWLAGQLQTATVTDGRDLFVCTHGSHDKCCAKYGYPFYRRATAIAAASGLADIRIWQVSHIGGHRFAPTLIDFPEGRYYGGLDPTSFTAILHRTGDSRVLDRVYRGWGRLPRPAQILERELIRRHGWDWFQYKVDSQVQPGEDERGTHVRLICQTANGQRLVYTADIVEDESKAVYLPGSCGAQVSKFSKYSVENLRTDDRQLSTSTAAHSSTQPYSP
jgi:hypothetical protein